MTIYVTISPSLSLSTHTHYTLIKQVTWLFSDDMKLLKTSWYPILYAVALGSAIAMAYTALSGFILTKQEENLQRHIRLHEGRGVRY